MQGQIVRLKRVVAEARSLDPSMTGQVIETPGMEVEAQYVKVQWAQPVTTWGDPKNPVWEYACDLEEVG